MNRTEKVTLFHISSTRLSRLRFTSALKTLSGEHVTEPRVRSLTPNCHTTSSGRVSASVHLTRRYILDSDRTTCQKPDSKLSYNFQWESFASVHLNQTLRQFLTVIGPRQKL
ncbi:hypothetical protein J6590_052897 [Homalodisca vitripennis]|nr:hypothetical protein J6590_052897 [Homalodisca vitripennis]